MPEPIARVLGLDGEDCVIRIEHHDEGMSSSEVPFYQALWSIKNDEASKRNK